MGSSHSFAEHDSNDAYYKTNSPSRIQLPQIYKDVEQGSPEWAVGRRECDVTASDMGTALGIDLYNTSESFFKSKVEGKDKQLNDYQNMLMKYGRDTEPVAAAFLMELLIKKNPNLRFKKCGLWLCGYKDRYTFGASPDLLVFANDDEVARSQPLSVVEIKCPYKRRRESFLRGTGYYDAISPKDEPPGAGVEPNDVLDPTSFDLSVHKGPLLDHSYYLQIQAQMMFTDVTTGYFFVYAKDGWVLISVERDDDLWNEVVLPKLFRFVSMVREGKKNQCTNFGKMVTALGPRSLYDSGEKMILKNKIDSSQKKKNLIIDSRSTEL